MCRRLEVHTHHDVIQIQTKLFQFSPGFARITSIDRISLLQTLLTLSYPAHDLFPFDESDHFIPLCHLLLPFDMTLPFNIPLQVLHLSLGLVAFIRRQVRL